MKLKLENVVFISTIVYLTMVFAGFLTINFSEITFLYWIVNLFEVGLQNEPTFIMFYISLIISTIAVLVSVILWIVGKIEKRKTWLLFSGLAILCYSIIIMVLETNIDLFYPTIIHILEDYNPYLFYTFFISFFHIGLYIFYLDKKTSFKFILIFMLLINGFFINRILFGFFSSISGLNLDPLRVLSLSKDNILNVVILTISILIVVFNNKIEKEVMKFYTFVKTKFKKIQ